MELLVPGWRVEWLPIATSTNDLALERIRAGRAEDRVALIAGEQVSGRGRPGRVWRSPPGSLSLTAMLPFWPERAGWAALAAGIAAATAARELGAPTGLKWPNDLLLDGRKLGGVLVESCAPRWIAVGIGINVINSLPEEEELRGRVARLAEAIPDVTVEQVARGVLLWLDVTWGWLAEARMDRLRASWEELDRTTGRTVRWSRDGSLGVAAGLDETGGLRIRREDGSVETALVGEVTFVAGPTEN